MRMREREKLANEIREAIGILHGLVRKARSENIEVVSPWLESWADDERLRVEIRWAREEKL